MLRKNEKEIDNFWQEYEEKTGEKVLKRGLGKYIKGWGEFDKNEHKGFWGLVITTSGGFRFHHFPQNSWIDMFTRFTSLKQAEEKTIFIPNEKIISNKSIKETKWWKRLLSTRQPQIVINYIDDKGAEKRLLFEAEYNAG